MTSDRPYRKAFEHGEATRRLLEAEGTQFDPLVIKTFMETAMENGNIEKR
jgi:HD-GYP domain-containing protein (c-di-GMP phosphodiesterase class II)